MNEWTPKDNEFVMVGERGPLRAVPQGAWGARCALFDDGTGAYVGEVPTAWLTPAPEPEPDEPTAPGALVRDGAGRLWARDDSHEWPWGCLAPYGDDKAWAQLYRPITVVLADPAEVEQLRDQVERLHAEVGALRDANDVVKADALHAEARADKLQRRIDRALEYVGASVAGTNIRRILRGES